MDFLLSKMILPWDFPGGPVVEILPFNAGVVDSILDLGAKISHSLQPKNINNNNNNEKKPRSNIVENSIRL